VHTLWLLHVGMHDCTRVESLRETVGAIEISRAGVLEKAYFIIPSLCTFLTKQSRRQILLGVNRANLQTMLTV